MQTELQPTITEESLMNFELHMWVKLHPDKFTKERYGIIKSIPWVQRHEKGIQGRRRKGIVMVAWDGRMEPEPVHYSDLRIVDDLEKVANLKQERNRYRKSKVKKASYSLTA